MALITSNTHWTAINADVLSIAALAPGGAPLAGDNKLFVTNHFGEVGVTLTLSDVNERVSLNGAGGNRHILRQEQTVQGCDLTLVLTDLDAPLFELACGFPMLTGAGGVGIGSMAPPVGTRPSPDGVCVEVFTWGWDGASRATDAIASPVFIDFVFPKVRFVPAELPLGPDFTRITLNGVCEENPSIGTGPNNNLPTAIGTAGGPLFSWFETGDVAPVPTVGLNYQTQPA